MDFYISLTGMMKTLVLVRFDIGASRGMSLSEEALEYADEILKCFHSRGKEIILRVFV